MDKNKPTILIIFGITGNLAQRFLLPVLKGMEHKNVLPTKFKLIGASRSNYSELASLVKAAEEELGGKAQKLFYLAVPPEACKDVVSFIGSSGLITGECKLLLEKPFGHDVESAKDLVEYIKKYFSEEQIYRIDHYLAKNSARKIITTSWPKKDVAGIEIVASEKIGIEGRANFYEQTGALKDFVQSHLLELAAITLMKEGENEPELRYQALSSLAVICDIESEECVKRGQYAGYREEVGNPQSSIETFVSLNLVSNDPSWRGVAIKIATGKAMEEKLTQIRIHYTNGEQLIFEIEPEADAYERVLEAAIAGNSNLFISSNEVLESWRILDSIQMTWKKSPPKLIIYPKGSDINKL